MKITIKIIFITLLACFTFVNGQTNSEILKRQAIENIQSGSFVKALDRLKNYISLNPADADGYSLRGLCYEKLNDYQNAYHDFKRAKQIDSTDSEIQKNYLRIETAWKNSIYDEIEIYRTKTKTNPTEAENFLKIADNYILLENYQAAEKWYDDYLKLDHNSTPEEILRYTEAFAKIGLIQKGETLLSLYVQKFPDDWRLFTRLGYYKLWSGKNDEAKNAFKSALKLKPFNKEAEEGLKLAESFVSFSIEEMKPIQNSYLIEYYSGILLKDPNRDDVRFNLVEQLIKSGLYEEAYSHLKYLAPNYEGNSRFDDLMEITEEGKEEYYDRLINSYLEKLDKNENDKESLIEISELYNSLRRYDDTEDLLLKYIAGHSREDDMIYLLAKTLSYDAKYTEAYQQIESAIAINPGEHKYKILAAKLIVIDKDEEKYEYAHKLLDEIIIRNPNDVDALTFLGRLYLLENNFEKANNYASLASRMDPSHPDLVELLFELGQKTPKYQPKKEESLVKYEPVKIENVPQTNNLEIARNLSLNAQCEKAIDYYLDYIEEKSANKELLLELADVYNCAEEYDEAIEIYNFLLERKDEYEIQKLKAKSYYLKEDYSETINILSKYAVDHTDDLEMQTLLADAYASEDEYDFARDTYTAIEGEAPEYFMIAQRKDWLPQPEIDFAYEDSENIEETEIDTQTSIGFITDNFFSNAVLYPEVNYYKGNDGFDFSRIGTTGEIGLLENFYIGGNVHRGSFSNDFGSLNYMSYLGNLIYRPSDYWKITTGYGKMTSQGNIDQNLFHGSVEFWGQTRFTRYKANAFYKYTDAATVFYSQGLVFSRLSTHFLNLEGWYRFRKGLNVYADYKLYLLEETPIFKENLGNSISLKVGKEFYEDFMAGYEYYFADFKYKIPTYYTPQKFDSHSLWGDWDIHTDAEWDINLMGKIGYIPDEDHIIREISARAVYKGFQDFLITAYGFAGETARDRIDYKSFSFFITATWNFIK